MNSTGKRRWARTRLNYKGRMAEITNLPLPNMCLTYAGKIKYTRIKGNNTFLLPVVVNMVSPPLEGGLCGNRDQVSSSAEFRTAHSRVSHGIKILSTWILEINQHDSHSPRHNSRGISSFKKTTQLFIPYLGCWWFVTDSTTDKNKANPWKLIHEGKIL